MQARQRSINDFGSNRFLDLLHDLSPGLFGRHKRQDSRITPRIGGQSSRYQSSLEHFMAFESFLSSITSASLRAVALHWNAARGNRLMPSWDELRPAAMAKQLPIIWAYKFDRSTGEFTGRLAGDRITEVFDKSLRGMRLQDFHPPEAGPWVTAMLLRVVSEPALHLSSGRVFKQMDRVGTGQRIILPLAADGKNGDPVLGVTEYHSRISAEQPIQVATDVEAWFPL